MPLARLTIRTTALAIGTRSPYSRFTITRAGNGDRSADREETGRIRGERARGPEKPAEACDVCLRLRDPPGGVRKKAPGREAAQGLRRCRRPGSRRELRWRHLPRSLYGEVRRRRLCAR